MFDDILKNKPDLANIQRDITEILRNFNYPVNTHTLFKTINEYFADNFLKAKIRLHATRKTETLIIEFREHEMSFDIL